MNPLPDFLRMPDLYLDTPPLWSTAGYHTTPQYALEHRFLEAERRHDRLAASLFVQVNTLTQGRAASLLGVHGLRHAVLRDTPRLLALASPRRRRPVREHLAQYALSLDNFTRDVDSVESRLHHLHPRWWPEHARLFDSRLSALITLSERCHVNPHHRKWLSGPRRAVNVTGFHLLALKEMPKLSRAIRRKLHLPPYDTHGEGRPGKE